MENTVNGAFLQEINRHNDERGFFEEVFSLNRMEMSVAQVNVSMSGRGVLRGLHVAPFAKLCTCVRGSLFDVVADVRKGSPTYGKWFGAWLTEENRKQMYVPAFCAHGFFAAEDNTTLLYLQDGTYDSKRDWSVHWQDAEIGVVWPEGPYIISKKDMEAKGLKDVELLWA